MVAWLEELAGLELDRAEAAAQAAGGSGAAFAAGEGLPCETAARLQQRSVLSQMQRLDTRTLVSELDPDAPTRYPAHDSVVLCCARLLMHFPGSASGKACQGSALPR